jgi:hypothetical protein
VIFTAEFVRYLMLHSGLQIELVGSGSVVRTIKNSVLTQ